MWAVLKCVLYVAAVLALAVPLGAYLGRVFSGEAKWAGRVFGPLERLFYRLAGVRPEQQMTWKQYAGAVLALNGLGIAAVYLLQRVQHLLPLNPAGLPTVPAELAFNTAASFATNTNWQAYGGETTLSYLTQMAGLTVQNFLSPATALAVSAAFARGVSRRSPAGLGNFWVDLTRSVLYVLLPIAAISALVLVSQGVVQTFGPYVTAHLVDPQRAADGAVLTEQTIALGPAASQVAIKQLGTNGGGFFNANSAHPFENPTPLSSWLQMLFILLLPAAQCLMFGALVKDGRQGRALLAAMLVIFLPMLTVAVHAEAAGNPVLATLGIDPAAGNLEGKEARFGAVESAMWTTASAATSNGSVNSMNDSFTPLGGLVPLWLILLGEVVFGGVGSGLYGMLLYALLAVFLGAMMVGRSPHYLGRRIEAREVKMVMLAILLPSAAIFLGSAAACLVPAGTAALGNPGAHGFSELLYAFASTSNGNGSAFGGITVSGPFYATLLGVCILVGRYWVIVPVLAIAGSLSGKRIAAVTPGTLPTHTPLFVGLLVGTVLLVGALSFFPALALGPIAEHFSLP
jgi:K+-transporting ATPase ATPase A chain